MECVRREPVSPAPSWAGLMRRGRSSQSPRRAQAAALRGGRPLRGPGICRHRSPVVTKRRCVAARDTQGCRAQHSGHGRIAARSAAKVYSPSRAVLARAAEGGAADGMSRGGEANRELLDRERRRLCRTGSRHGWPGPSALVCAAFSVYDAIRGPYAQRFPCNMLLRYMLRNEPVHLMRTGFRAVTT